MPQITGDQVIELLIFPTKHLLSTLMILVKYIMSGTFVVGLEY